MCICASVRRVSNRTPIVILQHPRERTHPVGTARLARLGLERVRIEVARGGGRRGISVPIDVPEGTSLLFPGAGARPLDSLSAGERPRALLVLDGTWSTAGKLYQDNAWMHGLPRVSLQPTEPGNYRIRKEPRAECLSTIEAIVMALRILDAGTHGVGDLDGLIEAFASMVDAQLRHAARGEPRMRRARERPSFAMRMPLAFRDAHARAVLIYTEFRHVKHGPRSKNRGLVYCVAIRPGDGARFAGFLRQHAPLSPELVRHMALPPCVEDAATDRDTFARRWRAFAGSDPVLLSWNKNNLDMLCAAVERPSRGVVLKGVFGNIVGHAQGGIDDAMKAHGIKSAPVVFPGRAGVRMAGLLALHDMIRSRVVAELRRAARSSGAGARARGR